MWSAWRPPGLTLLTIGEVGAAWGFRVRVRAAGQLTKMIARAPGAGYAGWPVRAALPFIRRHSAAEGQPARSQSASSDRGHSGRRVSRTGSGTLPAATSRSQVEAPT